MRFYKPADSQPCYYCERIALVEQQKDYPIRNGIYTFENYVFRCAWHARFICSKCENEHHFSWFYWCPKTEELVCGDCVKPTMKPVKFWDRTYAYQFYCENCDEFHYDLMYAEFQGRHPWQLGNCKIQTNIETTEPWKPLWSPHSERDGKEIELKEALKLPNRVMLLKKDLNYPSDFGVVQYAVPEENIKYSQAHKWWEENSQKWIEITETRDRHMSGDPNRQFIIDPALWKLIGSVNNLNVLDAGCGNGYLTRQLASKGANAIGVDFSKPFIDHCKNIENEMNLGCNFYEASITDMPFIDACSIDLVVSNIVMVDVLDYEGAFKEIARVLKDGGRFVWSNVHPVFGRAGSAIDPKFPRDSKRNESRYLKVVDRYFDSGGHQMKWMSTSVWQFFRTFEEYSKALKNAGFVISEIVEPRPTLELIQQNPRELSFDSDRWTHFIIFECVKYPRKVE
ncbi:MAG: class I SAM-dependent methyltransferase [Promethearchaeota archaeon]